MAKSRDTSDALLVHSPDSTVHDGVTTIRQSPDGNSVFVQPSNIFSVYSRDVVTMRGDVCGNVIDSPNGIYLQPPDPNCMYWSDANRVAMHSPDGIYPQSLDPNCVYWPNANRVAMHSPDGIYLQSLDPDCVCWPNANRVAMHSSDGIYLQSLDPFTVRLSDTVELGATHLDASAMLTAHTVDGVDLAANARSRGGSIDEYLCRAAPAPAGEVLDELVERLTARVTERVLLRWERPRESTPKSTLLHEQSNGGRPELTREELEHRAEMVRKVLRLHRSNSYKWTLESLAKTHCGSSSSFYRWRKQCEEVGISTKL